MPTAARVPHQAPDEQPRHAPGDRAQAALLAAIVLLGAALRFATLNTQSIDLDESVTFALLHQGLSGMLRAIPKTESTPPLYYVTAWAWTKVFGSSQVGLRSLSALAGTATIPLAHATARRLASQRAGLVAAALTAVSPWLIWYSQEARAYALFALLALASFAAFLAALERPCGRTLAGWAALSALALASHYFAVFLLVPEAAWLLIALPASRRGVCGAVALVGAAGAALVPLALEQAHDIRGKAGFLQTPLSSRIAAIPTRFLVGEDAPSAGKAAAVAIALLLVAGGAVLLARERRRGGWPAALPAALAVPVLGVLVPVALAVAGRDYLDARNLVGCWAPLAIVLAVGYAAAGRGGLVAAGALGALFLTMFAVGNTDLAVERTDYRGAAAALGPSPGPGQRAIVVSPDYNWTPLGYYLPDYPQLGAGDAGVREVDLIGWDTQRLGAQARRGLEARGFRLVGERVLQRLRLARFRAPAVVSISRDSLLAARLGTGSATVLIQGRQAG